MEPYLQIYPDAKEAMAPTGHLASAVSLAANALVMSCCASSAIANVLSNIALSTTWYPPGLAWLATEYYEKPRHILPSDGPNQVSFSAQRHAFNEHTPRIAQTPVCRRILRFYKHAADSQVKAGRTLQWPHHGAWNLTNTVCRMAAAPIVKEEEEPNHARRRLYSAWARLYTS